MHIIATYIYHTTLTIINSYNILTPLTSPGDLNARHLILGHNNKNIKGEFLATLINRYKCMTENGLSIYTLN